MQALFLLDDHTDNNLPIDVVVERLEAVRDAILHVNKPHPEYEHVVCELTRQ